MRITIFLLYLWAVTRLKELRRVFEYHGAEHKTISCYEAGLGAHAGERARASAACTRAAGRASCSSSWSSRSFVFAPLGTPAWYWLFASRIVGIPLVAGLAFEVIKWMGRNRTQALGARAHVARA